MSKYEVYYIYVNEVVSETNLDIFQPYSSPTVDSSCEITYAVINLVACKDI